MIPQEMATKDLAKAEAEIAEWELRVAHQRERIRVFHFESPISLELSKQILETFEAALRLAQERRNRLLER